MKFKKLETFFNIKLILNADKGILDMLEERNSDKYDIMHWKKTLKLEKQIHFYLNLTNIL